MDLTLALIALAALVAVTTIAGLVLRRRQGRARAVASEEVVDPRRFGADALGAEATLLQFSTEMCSRCPGVHRMLSELADAHDGVRHLDVDLTHRPDIAQHFRVLQTPPPWSWIVAASSAPASAGRRAGRSSSSS